MVDGTTADGRRPHMDAVQTPQGLVALNASPRSVLASSSDIVTQFVEAAIDDGLQRLSSRYAEEGLPCAETALDNDTLVQWLVDERMDEVVCAYAPWGQLAYAFER